MNHVPQNMQIGQLLIQIDQVVCRYLGTDILIQLETFTPSILFYDVLLTEPGGNKNYYLEGKLFISEGYTA